MKRTFLSIALWVFVTSCATTSATEPEIQAAVATVDYGDYTSATLTGKAWKALAKKDYPELFAYTRKCVELYGEEGKKMNAGMTEFEPAGTASEKWALNDVGTCLYIMGSAYEDLEMYPEAAKAYRTLVNEYNYAQCWDPKGWFWRPAENAALRAERYDHLR